MFKQLIIICFVCSALLTYSQEFDAGLYLGMSATQIDGDSYGGYNKPGLSLGAYINRELMDKVDWQMGLRYIQKGSRKSSNEAGAGMYADYKASLHYLEMPLTLRYYHYKKLDFEAGITLGYIVKAFEEFNKTGAAESTDSFDKFELGGIAGLNYKINDKFSLGGYFQYSWLPIRPYITKTHWLVNRGQHNNVLLFTLNYTIEGFR